MWFKVFVLAVMSSLAAADIPVDCRYGDIKGHWIFQESVRTLRVQDNCRYMPHVYEKKIRLDFPNTAEDEVGNVGTWTMVYNQGFEVRIAGRSYFAFSEYTTGANETTSNCDHTKNGRARDYTIRNWSCFKGIKQKALGARSKTATRVILNSDKREKLMESILYKQEERFVDAINRHQSNWTATIYPQFEGLTLMDMHRIKGAQPVRESQRLIRNHKSSIETRLHATMLPRSFDWRNVSGVNYVRPVKNQGKCGSCYAFASTGLLESQLLINSGGQEKIDLSAEDFVGCSRLSQGCDGGFPYLVAGRYAQEFGIVSEECVPYNISNQCNRKRDACRKFYTTEYRYVGGYYGACNEEEMMLAMYQNGPLAVGIEVASDFVGYMSGVYHHTGLADAFNPLEETNHAVLAIGWGQTEQGEKYWVVQNSWGTKWGMDGYVFIRKGTDEIAIESMAMQAVVYP